MWVKICGLTSARQAREVEDLGADAIGLNLHPRSPRSVSAAVAAAIREAVSLEVVLVVVDLPEPVLAAMVAEIRPTMVQLHGHEPEGYGADLGVPLLRAWRASPGVLERLEAARPARFLLDAYVPGEPGGTGRRVDLDLAARAAGVGELVLAGGLNPDNVGAAVARVRPWGVDVASGVERAPGDKDLARVAAFIERARGGA